MIKLRAFTKKLSHNFDGSSSNQKRSVSDYDRKPADVKTSRSLLRRRAISSTKNIETSLPPLPKQQYTVDSKKRSQEGLQNGTTQRPFSQESHISSDGKYYIYDPVSFEQGPQGKNSKTSKTVDPDFHILKLSDGINPTSAREVLSALIKQFKKTLIQQNAGDIEKDNSSIRAAMEIFKPNLSHYVPHEIKETEAIIESLFPRPGCSLTGDALDSAIKTKLASSKSKLILSLRIIWSRLTRGIVPWESYLKFCTVESKQNFSKMCFKNFMPQILPDADYKRCAFEFIDLLFAIISKVDLVVDKVAQVDLIFTAAQVCFVRTPELLNYIRIKSTDTDDCIVLAKLYRARGEALYRLFVSYLNSLAEEGEIKDFYLIDNFRINEYPPKPYKPLTQRALTLTIPQLWDPETNNFNELIRVSAKAQTRIYSPHHAFSKLENSFLDNYEDNPYKVVNNLFSRSSKRYLDKFDPSFDVEFFKGLSKRNGGNSTLGPADQLPVATWINSCKERGFNDFLSVLDDNNHGEGTLALGLTFPKSTHEESESLPPLKVSKAEISESFISSWKYETFLGMVHNTLVIKLTKRVGDCEWLIIAMDERTEKRGYTSPMKPREHDSTHGTPSAGSKGKRYHAATLSDASSKPRPPPPSLLGEPSSSPLINSNSGCFSDQSGSAFSSRPPSDIGSAFAKAHMKANSVHSKKPSDFVISDSPLQQSSPKVPPKASEFMAKSGSNNSSKAQDESRPNEKKSEHCSSNDAKPTKQNPSPLSEQATPETQPAGSTPLEKLADTFQNDKAEITKEQPSSLQSTKQPDEMSTEGQNDPDLSKKTAESNEADNTGSDQNPKVLSSPFAAPAGSQNLKDTVTTPISRFSPDRAPNLPKRVQNPSIGSPDSVTMIPHSADTSVDLTETTDVDEDGNVVHKQSSCYGNVLDSSSNNDLSKLRQQEDGTVDLLNDFLENYNTLSAEPLNYEDGPTVFEQVKGFYEKGLNEAGRAQPEIERQEIVHQEQEADHNGEDGATSPVNQFSKMGSINSKNGTWFSCNVTPPNKLDKNRNFKNLKLGSRTGTQSHASNKLEANGKHLDVSVVNHGDQDQNSEEDHDMFYSGASDLSDIADQDGVWLEANSKPSSPVDIASPTHMMFRNVMLRTKRSLRSLKTTNQQQ
ncbi:LAFA_0F14224g1_1 [Lachancea sp. 'fantastica']|nr:LAFA_0F14224g1_1 [Lachancea sp. 'fantastica']